MKRLWVAGCVVVGLLAVIVVPVLAAVVWEWETGNTCIWFSGGNPSCSVNGIDIPSQTMVSGMPSVTSSEEPLDVITDCETLFLSIYVDGEPVLYMQEFPVDIAMLPGYEISLYTDDLSPCHVSSITLGEDDATPTPTPTMTPTPTAVALLDGFTTTSVFSTASELVAALGSVIFAIGGIYLGFKVMGWLVRRFRA